MSVGVFRGAETVCVHALFFRLVRVSMCFIIFSDATVWAKNDREDSECKAYGKGRKVYRRTDKGRGQRGIIVTVFSQFKMVPSRGWRQSK